MKVAITAGGTIEKIDNVRTISNSSSGLLGIKLAEAFLKLDCIEKLYYICGKHALKPPKSPLLEEVRITDVKSLEAEIRQKITIDKIDAAVFSMAVSDYTVDSITTEDLVASSFQEKGGSGETALREALRETGIDRSGKIHSGQEGLILRLKPTSKVIGVARALSDSLVIAGFKLMDNPEKEELIATGYRLLKTNAANMVFANANNEVTLENHIGYLIKPDGSYVRLEGREAIAEAIALAVAEDVNRREKI